MMMKDKAKIEFTDEEAIIIMAAINKCTRGYQPNAQDEPTLKNVAPIIDKITRAFFDISMDEAAKRLLK